jgi:hypothetical protein
MLCAQILKKSILVFADKNAISKAYAGNKLPIGDVLYSHGVAVMFEE